MTSSPNPTAVTQDPAFQPVVVTGDGWAALASAAFAARAGHPVTWVSGSAGGLRAPLPALGLPPGSDAEAQGEGEPGGSALAGAWECLARLTSAWDLAAGPAREGIFLREFRNKSFRAPRWSKESQAVSARAELWGAERLLSADRELHVGTDLLALEDELRRRLLASGSLRRIEGVPLTQVRARAEGLSSVLLASGEELPAWKVVVASPWGETRTVEGLGFAVLPWGSKKKTDSTAADVARKWKTVGALQVLFEHSRAFGQGVREGFYSALSREAGQEDDRHVFGYLSGARSLWTTFLAPEEGEDNHAIAKRLRRIKQALTRMFGQPEWLGEGTEFGSSVSGESVRYLEGAFASGGEAVLQPHGPAGEKREADAALVFLTDAFGPGAALEQVRQLTGCWFAGAWENGRPAELAEEEPVQEEAADHSAESRGMPGTPLTSESPGLDRSPEISASGPL
ncbi:MAG: hypothetical protein IT285_05245 [Bdellovibrionales bacterium]|nr:hypothetical protein [Bdellovibrionales bacterium]